MYRFFNIICQKMDLIILSYKDIFSLTEIENISFTSCESSNIID